MSAADLVVPSTEMVLILVGWLTLTVVTGVAGYLLGRFDHDRRCGRLRTSRFDRLPAHRMRRRSSTPVVVHPGSDVDTTRPIGVLDDTQVLGDIPALRGGDR